DDPLRAIAADHALDARLEVAARDVLGAREVAGVPLVRLADVEQHGVAVERLDLGRVELIDLAADSADDLRPGCAHAISVLEKRSGFQYFTKDSAREWGDPPTRPGVNHASINADEGREMRTRTLLTQVLAVNTALVALTTIVAAVIARGRFEDVFELQ